MNKIILSSIIVILMFMYNINISASNSYDYEKIGSCSEGNLIINTTPDIQPGNGGQNFISDVTFQFHNAWSTDPSRYTYDGNIQIYDWNGKHVEDVEINKSNGVATGLVDGTYTFTFTNDIGDVNTGQFSVDHNIDNLVHVEMAQYLCEYDTKTDYMHNVKNDEAVNNVDSVNSIDSVNNNYTHVEDDNNVWKEFVNNVIELLKNVYNFLNQN